MVARGAGQDVRINIVLVNSKQAAALEVPPDTLDGPLKHGADLGGLHMPEPFPAEFAALAIPSAIENGRLHETFQLSGRAFGARREPARVRDV